MRLPLLSDVPRPNRKPPRTVGSNGAKGSGTGATLGLIRDGREARPALSELASWGVRRDFDPPLLAEVVHDAVGFLERLAFVHLGARHHVDAVAAVLRERGARAARSPERDESEAECSRREQRQDRRDDDDAHIRPALVSVSTVSGGLMVRSMLV